MDRVIKTTKDLTKEDVLRIWTMRAGHNSNVAIAKDLNAPAWLVSQVITSNLGPKVPIPREIRKAALATVRKHPRSKREDHNTTPTAKANGEDTAAQNMGKQISRYITACREREEARRECINIGLTDEGLKYLQDLAEIHPSKRGGSKRTPKVKSVTE